MAPEDNYEETTTTPTFDLARLGTERLLALFSGVCAIGFGALALVLHLTGAAAYPGAFVVGYTLAGGAIFSFAVAAVFGLGMLLAFRAMATRAAEGSILALAFSIVLLAFGALPGLIAGILGLIGALVGLVRNVKFNPN